ncbi:hypothetical protein Tco_1307985, partial [Tanacetum coccineum]
LCDTRSLIDEDKKAFKKLQEMETQLSPMEVVLILARKRLCTCVVSSAFLSDAKMMRHLTFCNIWDLVITGSLPSAFEYMQIDVEIGQTGKTIHLEVKISDTNCFFLKRSYDVLGSSGILDSPLLIQVKIEACHYSTLMYYNF